jgi:hypothetical protein
MNRGKRMDDLDASLTADQIWWRWLDTTTSKFSSRLEYMKWASQDPENRLPFPTFDRELTPYATAKTREKASERRKKLVTMQETLRFYYCLFTEVDDTVNQYSSPLITLWLKVALRRLVDDSIADSHPLRSVSVPMRQEVAATVRTALDNYLMPQRDFCDNLCRWISDGCVEATGQWIATGRERRITKWKEIWRTLFEIDAIKWGNYVQLEPFPYRSLGAASLVDGRWIDRRLLELGEFAALLVSCGYRLQDPPDRHPLEPRAVVNNAGLPPSEQELLPIRNEAECRLRQLKGRKKKIRGKVYLDIEDYRHWTGRTVTGELKPMRGLDVAHWNRCLDSQGGEGPAEIAGVKLHPLRAPFRSSDFIACEEEIEFARKSETRSMLLEKIHGNGISALGGPVSRSLLRELIDARLIDLLATNDLVKRMEEQFRGHQFVFRKTKEQLARQITSMQNVVIGFNLMLILAKAQGFNESGSAGSQIDFDSAGISAEERSKVMFNTIKLTAEAFALESLGRHAGAMKIASELMAKTNAAETDGAQAPPEPKAPEPPGPPLFERFVAYTDELDRAQKAKDKKESEEK